MVHMQQKKTKERETGTEKNKRERVQLNLIVYGDRQFDTVKQQRSSKASYLSLSNEYKGYKNENAKLHTNHTLDNHPG